MSWIEDYQGAYTRFMGKKTIQEANEKAYSGTREFFSAETAALMAACEATWKWATGFFD